ncbi:MAG: hypothetical protein JWM21_4832 [Acidobacteria bacterium]|nr:hypothetical protein [Acidobacteriota bacterium]
MAILFLFVFSLLFQTTISAQDPPQNANPRAVPLDATSDVGAYRKGEKISHDFLIKNEGKSPLLITEARPSCGCTVAEFDKTIGPGAVGKVRVVVDTSALFGAIAKGVTVLTNDPLLPQFQLILRANVAPLITVKPGYARFLIVQDDSAPSESIQVLSAADGTPFDVLRAETGVAGLKVTYHEATAAERLPNLAGKQWVLRLVLASDAPVGSLSDYVHVTTNHPQQRQVDIPVSGFVRPLFTSTPSEAQFGSANVPIGQILILRNFSTQSIALTSVESDTKGIDVLLEPVEQGREYNLKIALQTNVAKGPLNGKITIHTDSKKVPVLVIPVKGTIR